MVRRAGRGCGPFRRLRLVRRAAFAQFFLHVLEHGAELFGNGACFGGHSIPGDLLHIDTKKLGRIERMGHRVTGRRHHDGEHAGWEYLFVAVDDHAQVGFSELKAHDEIARTLQMLAAVPAKRGASNDDRADALVRLRSYPSRFAGCSTTA